MFQKLYNWKKQGFFLKKKVFKPIVKLQRIGWLSWMIYIGRFQGKPLTVQIRDNGLYNIIHPGKLLSVKNYVLRGFGTVLKLLYVLTMYIVRNISLILRNYSSYYKRWYCEKLSFRRFNETNSIIKDQSFKQIIINFKVMHKINKLKRKHAKLLRQNETQYIIWYCNWTETPNKKSMRCSITCNYLKYQSLE